MANATAGIKLVADAMRDHESTNSGTGFWYGYHADSHTSLVGAREVANKGQRCFLNDDEVEDWIKGLHSSRPFDEGATFSKLFAYPAQSNMTGRRLPLSSWCKKLRMCNEPDKEQHVFSLLDAASLVSTSPLDLSDCDSSPDFVTLSFYKIFGFPDLGALIVRKASGHIFDQRKYFGGGTVDMVTSLGGQWHAKNSTSLHSRLEDGTLAFHSIIGLSCALNTHKRLYGSMANVSRHTGFLARTLFQRLSSKKHANGKSVCEMYKSSKSSYDEPETQGPIVCFNLKSSNGEWVGKSDVEKLASVKDIQIRSGGLCNPGGAARYLNMSTTEIKRNYDAGQRCGDDNDIIAGKPTGSLRVSFGAMSSMRDVNRFLEFVDEFYVDKNVRVPSNKHHLSNGFTSTIAPLNTSPKFYVEKLCVYPVKSCGAFTVPGGVPWEVRPEGLAWDRQWCLIHQGTGVALNQKRYPKMALIRPFLDIDRGVLRICRGFTIEPGNYIEVPLSESNTTTTAPAEICNNAAKSSKVCDDRVTVTAYLSDSISLFFTEFLDVPCMLARFPPEMSSRYSKHMMGSSTVTGNHDDRTLPSLNPMPGSFPEQSSLATETPSSSSFQNPILLSNESPLLLISRSSVAKLNETIKSMTESGIKSANPLSAGKAVAADVFRANIIVAEDSTGNPSSAIAPSHPYVEDTWTSFEICNQKFDVLGACQRCQMVCVDQFTASRSDEPFSTLAKTRRVDGKVVFGRHVALSQPKSHCNLATTMIKVGDAIYPNLT